MKILITGSGGQLATEFINLLEKKSHEVIPLSKYNLDISRLKLVLEAVSHFMPDIILNCAAYNHVDKAEEDFIKAFSINGLGARNLAFASKKYNCFLIHYSTDYIFNGEKENFYTEDDEPSPINTYGKSKLSGEKFLIDETDRYLIFRVSWVYGKGKQNFLYKLSEWMKKKRVLRVVSDQISIPTFTEDIVKLTLLAIDKGLEGVFNLTNSGYASRYEVARYFAEKMSTDNLIFPVGSDYFPSPAKRPYFTAMSNYKISKNLAINIPHWRDGIDRFIEHFNF